MALSSEDLQAISDLLQPIQNEVQDMKSGMQDMKSEIQDVKSGKQDMKSEIQDMKSGLQDMKSEIQDVKSGKQDMQELKQKVTKTELIIENEIHVNIQRVAEWYLDLSRKLNECIKLSSDIKNKQEIQDIYINMHNCKLKTLG